MTLSHLHYASLGDDPYASNKSEELMREQENNLEDGNEWRFTLDSANSSDKIWSLELQLLPAQAHCLGSNTPAACSIHLLLVQFTCCWCN